MYDCYHHIRPEGSADVRYAECSMKDGFGLKYLHKFFSIPFLHLQVRYVECLYCTCVLFWKFKMLIQFLMKH